MVIESNKNHSEVFPSPSEDRKGKQVKAITSDFWRKDNLSGAAQFGSMKGFRYMADSFADRLPWAVR